jgi:hypothetical protein
LFHDVINGDSYTFAAVRGRRLSGDVEPQLDALAGNPERVTGIDLTNRMSGIRGTLITYCSKYLHKSALPQNPFRLRNVVSTSPPKYLKRSSSRHLAAFGHTRRTDNNLPVGPCRLAGQKSCPSSGRLTPIDLNWKALNGG